METTTTTTIRCPSCGTPLGETDGARLFVGRAFCDRIVTLRCAAERCNGRVVWRPVGQPPIGSRTGVLASI